MQPEQPITNADMYCMLTSRRCSFCVSTHSFPDWSDQLPGSCSDVSVLWPGSFWTKHVQIPLVEALSHMLAAGQYFSLCMCVSGLVFYYLCGPQNQEPSHGVGSNVLAPFLIKSGWISTLTFH